MSKLAFSNADITDWCSAYTGDKFHAVLTDCPYEYGFMGKSWDSSGVSFNPDTWAAISEHMYPGAFGMTYGGPRTWHRVAVAIEDAGLVIHPTIFAWIYSSGFPKATRIDTQIDKAAGADRKVIGIHGMPASEIFQGGRISRRVEITAPATELSMAWQGHRYGLQALKPAVEPVIMFQKPYSKKPVDSIAGTGAGALWIAGSVVGDGSQRSDGGRGSEQTKFITPATPMRFDRPDGPLWPSNFIVSHHPLCTDRECHGDCNVAHMGDDAKFFMKTTMLAEAIEHNAIIYASKPGKKERHSGFASNANHDTLKPISVNAYLARLLLPPQMYSPRRLLVPFSGLSSEVIGGIIAGWDYIHGVELSSEYSSAGAERAGWWNAMSEQYGDNIDRILNFSTVDHSKSQIRMKL